MFQYLILAIVITILISLIYYVFCKDRIRRKKSEKFINNSAGTFDESARRALDELTQIRNPTPADHFRRGQLLQYNLLEGNQQIMRRQRNVVGDMIQEYTNALADFNVQDNFVNPDFMMYRIEDFHRNLQIFDDDNDELVQLALGFDTMVNNRAPVVRQELIEERVNRAVSNSTTRAEAIEKYFDNSIKFTDDRQNVHDSKVNSDLRETLRKIKATAPRNIEPVIICEEIDYYIHNDYTDDPNNAYKVTAASTALQTMSRGELITTFNERENYILSYVWERCKHPSNSENMQLMKEAVANALADSVENGTLVCINGRCSRVLNSLVLLDFDRDISSGVMTFEAYKNQIFQETKEIINQEIERAKLSSNVKLQNVGLAYDGEDVEVDEDVENEFKQEIKREIDRNMEKYSTKLTPVEISNISEECYIYAAL
ncbi:Hypothetical protein PACV_397 [Pacmanvirus A23]|uniref:Hypothetical protein n=1 Tax=Pacmanvirus A23 TaxID=1932881 RepID=UPI000A095602|nr:Hypothetical protein B9W72_gp393 [Pacmanvirus A23]SIP86110.1 Hypothetical protein PACV_397 [Pacmanvirus A23]